MSKRTFKKTVELSCITEVEEEKGVTVILGTADEGRNSYLKQPVAAAAATEFVRDVLLATTAAVQVSLQLCPSLPIPVPGRRTIKKNWIKREE